jgi:hypothetical protein
LLPVTTTPGAEAEQRRDCKYRGDDPVADNPMLFESGPVDIAPSSSLAHLPTASLNWTAFDQGFSHSLSQDSTGSLLAIVLEVIKLFIRW